MEHSKAASGGDKGAELGIDVLNAFMREELGSDVTWSVIRSQASGDRDNLYLVTGSDCVEAACYLAAQLLRDGVPSVTVDANPLLDDDGIVVEKSMKVLFSVSGAWLTAWRQRKWSH